MVKKSDIEALTNLSPEVRQILAICFFDVRDPSGLTDFSTEGLELFHDLRTVAIDNEPKTSDVMHLFK